MIEGHGHLFLHPYNEAKWDAQVLNEQLALRTARAVVHARQTLDAGFTTLRDLGTEGAGYADVGLQAGDRSGDRAGAASGGRTKAIVARGAYGPKGFEPGVAVPQGAEEASGVDEVVARRPQPDRRRRRRGEALRRLSLACGRGRAARPFRWPNYRPPSPPRTMPGARSRSTPPRRRHAPRDRGGRGHDRAWLWRHRRDLRPDAARGVTLCPTLAAADAVARYGGWNGAEPGAGVRHAQPQGVRAGAESRRADLRRGRRRGLRPWRQCARAGADGRAAG